jgi:hypothetical protein
MESLEKLPKRIRPSLKDLAAEENALPLQTLQEWKRLGNKSPDYNPQWGRPSTLTEDQEMFFDGKVISRLSKHLPCTQEWPPAGLLFTLVGNHQSLQSLVSCISLVFPLTRLLLGWEAKNQS